MKRLFQIARIALCVALFLPAVGHAQGVFVASAVGTQVNPGSSATVVITPGAAGHFLIYAFRYTGDVTNNGLSGNSNTYVHVVETTCTSGSIKNGDCCTGTTSSDGCTAVYYVESCNSGATTATFAVSANANLQGTVLEFSGMATSSSIDQITSKANSSAVATADGGTTATTGQTAEVWFGHCTSIGGDVTTWTPGTGYTKPATASGVRIAQEYQIVSATGTANATFGISPSRAYACHTTTFKAASAATFKTQVGGFLVGP